MNHKLIKTGKKGFLEFSKHHVTRMDKDYASRIAFFKTLGFEIIRENKWEEKGQYDTDGWGGLKGAGGNWRDLYERTTLTRDVTYKKKQVTYTITITQRNQTEYSGGFQVKSIKIKRSDHPGSKWFIANYKCFWKYSGGFNDLLNIVRLKETHLNRIKEPA